MIFSSAHGLLGAATVNACVGLLADNFTMLRVIFFLIVGAVWLFNRLLAAKQAKPAPPATRPAPRRPPVRPPGRAPGAQPGRSGDSLSAEIEQFLQESAGRKREAAPRQPAVKPTPVRTLVSTERKAAVEAEAAVDAKVLERPNGEAMADAVRRHLDTRQFDARVSNLTEDMQRADVQREQHLKKTFDHKLGRLTDTSHSQVEAPGALTAAQLGEGTANAIGAMLSKPENLRHAIVLGEILQRPEHRW